MRRYQTVPANVCPRTPSLDPDVTIESLAGAIIVRPTGPRLAERELLIIRPKVTAVLSSSVPPPRVLVLDMTRVHLVTSMGLSLCIDMRNDAMALGAKTVVFGANEQLDSLFRMVRAHRLFRMVRSRTELQHMLAA